MKNTLLIWGILLAISSLSACKKCQLCEVREADTLDVLVNNIEICGTDDDLESEQQNIKDNYSCIECVVTTSFGPTSTGFQCGDRNFTDSIETTVRTGAIASGLNFNCTLYRDTLKVTCLLKND